MNVVIEDTSRVMKSDMPAGISKNRGDEGGSSISQTHQINQDDVMAQKGQTVDGKKRSPRADMSNFKTPQKLNLPMQLPTPGLRAYPTIAILEPNTISKEQVEEPIGAVQGNSSWPFVGLEDHGDGPTLSLNKPNKKKAHMW